MNDKKEDPLERMPSGEREFFKDYRNTVGLLIYAVGFAIIMLILLFAGAHFVVGVV